MKLLGIGLVIVVGLTFARPVNGTTPGIRNLDFREGIGSIAWGTPLEAFRDKFRADIKEVELSHWTSKVIGPDAKAVKIANEPGEIMWVYLFGANKLIGAFATWDKVRLPQCDLKDLAQYVFENVDSRGMKMFMASEDGEFLIYKSGEGGRIAEKIDPSHLSTLWIVTRDHLDSVAQKRKKELFRFREALYRNMR